MSMAIAVAWGPGSPHADANKYAPRGSAKDDVIDLLDIAKFNTLDLPQSSRIWLSLLA